MTRSPIRAVAVLVAAGLLTSGCGSEQVLTPAPQVDAVFYPVVTDGQLTGVLDAVDAAVSAATLSQDPKDFGRRASGPYLEIMSAGFRVAKARKAASEAAPVVRRTRLVVPEQVGWPRTIIVAGNAPGRPTPLLRVLRSATARAPYALWGELVMLPGATLPATAPPSEGVPVLSPRSPGLMATPQQALERYADVLTKGGASRYADQFGADELRRQVAARRSADRKALKGVAESVSDMHRLDPRTMVALRTSDGGAIVVGELRQTYTISVKSGAGKITAQGDEKAMAGRGSFTKRLTRTAVEVVALVVPPEGASPIRVIAAQKADVAVSGS